MVRVLACDDDPSIRQLLEVVLEGDHAPVVVSNADEAMARLAEEDNVFDLVVLDIMMPETDGLEMLRKLRRSGRLRDLPVIMLTARATEDDHLRAFTTGADAYLTKPFEPDELLATIESVMSRSADERREARERERAKAALLRHVERRFE